MAKRKSRKPRKNNSDYDGPRAEQARRLSLVIDRLTRLVDGLMQRTEHEPMDARCVTTVEHIIQARDRVKGAAFVVLDLLATVWGPLPEDIEQRVCHLSFDRLDALARSLVDFRCLDDLRFWLQEHEEPASLP